MRRRGRRRFTETPYKIHVQPSDIWRAFDPGDVIQCSSPCACSRRIVRHKDQKDSRSDPNADSDAETSEEFSKKSVAYAIAYCFCKAKESFADSVPDAKEQVKAQESVSYSDTNRVTVGDRNSVCQSRGNTGTCSRKEGVAERLAIA